MAPKPRKGSSRASVDHGPDIPPSGERLIKPIPRRNDSAAHVGDDEVGDIGSSSAIASTSLPAPTPSEVPAVTENSTSAAVTPADAPPLDRVAPTSQRLNTMVSDTLASSVGFSSGTILLDYVKEKLCEDSSSAFVGPMKARDFLEAFVPPPPTPQGGQQRVMPEVSFKHMYEATNEIQMYSPYIKICEQLDEDHTMKYYDTHATNDSHTAPPGAPSREGLSPDIMTFHKDRIPQDDAPTDFTVADRADEFKFSISVDPFDDKPNKSKYPFEACSKAGKSSRAQITAYAAAMLELQFRTFVFSVLAMGKYVRLIRWDRSGAIVTEAFNYQEDPEPLAQFLWRYNFLSRAQRGFDESVKVIEATDDTHDLPEARKALADYMPSNSDLYLLRMIPLDMSSPPTNQPSPPSADTSASLDSPAEPSAEPDMSVKYYYAQKTSLSNGWDYYVTAPTMSDRGPFGRTTRSLYVFNRITKTVHHLKDTNRIMSSTQSVEHETINELGEKKVRNIGTVHAAWDVAPWGKCYDTVTPTFCDGEKIDAAFASAEGRWYLAKRVYRVYRLITNELGTPIWKFKNWEQVMRVMIDTFEALDDAEKAGWRHRDVSAGNIMICGDRGLLIDWDASQRSKDMNKPSETRVPELTGTWQFMSLRRLRKIDGRHDAVDDMESVFWVLLWLAFNYGVHSLDPDQLKGFLYKIFDQREVIKGCSVGGDGKDALFEKKYLNGYIPNPFSPPGLQKTLENLHRTFRVRPPQEPQVADMTKIRAQMELARYQNDLMIYNYEKENLNDSSHLRTLLKEALDNYDWPPHGPAEHIIPADHDRSQMTAHLQKALSAGVRQQRVAQRSASFSREPTSGRAGKAKIIRTDDTGDSRKVTRYAPLDERDEDRARKGENA